MGFHRHIVAWVLAVTFAAGCEHQSPTKNTPQPSFPGWFTIELHPAGNGILRAMHGCHFDMPRLFARTAGWMIGLEDVLLHAERRLCDTELVVRHIGGDPEAQDLSGRLWDAIEWARRRHAERPHHGLTDLDLTTIRHFASEAGYRVEAIPWDKPSDMHAYVDPVNKVIALPGQRLTDTRGCERATALHEMTHFFQFVCLPDGGFAHCCEPLTQAYDSHELAAYIVEVAERVRQGWTVAMFEENDRARMPQHEQAWVFEDVPNNVFAVAAPVVRPRIEAALLVQLVRQHGPQLTGDMGMDLRVLRNWVKRFETFSRFRYLNLPPDIQRGWMTLARLQLVIGHVDPLASTAQTWLASQGGPAAVPRLSPPPEDRIYGPGTDDRLWADVLAASPEAAERARRFRERLSSR